ncbi:hypothetical protein BDV41DRAFT_169821 [Aspergillus transmontanensis]|uniref:HNH nuclease domain-containing protein n=1 Tax=Aspergillus transmontanensis TaxID=1034304 RepID=A0A5N6WJU8_9EURO|nr:hypothetical protein BDV41DRAFT_169821 [Aspergillus transmontanensis]
MDPPRRGRSGTVLPALNDNGDTQDEIYSEPCQRRLDLLEQLDIILDHEHVTPSFWAVLMMSDIELLEKLVVEAEKSPYLVKFCQHACTAIPLTWKQKEPRFRQSNQSASSTSSGTNNRNETLKKKAKKRDNESCVIRKQSAGVQVAHIYPWCLLSGNQTNVGLSYPPFWEMLKYFWSPARISLWHSKIFTNPERPGTPYDSISNLICLSSDLHQAWTDGRFALRPLEYNAEKTELKFQFYYQPAPNHSLGDRISLLTRPGSSRDLDGLYRNQGTVLTLVLVDDNGQVLRVRSGQEFTFKTSDPVELPLPSKELLEMAWILARVVNLSGAGEEKEIEEFSSDDGYDIGITAKTERIRDWLEKSAQSSDNSSEMDIDTTGITSAGPSPMKTRDITTETENTLEQHTLTRENEI